MPAGLALGRAFRRLNMTVTVGQTVMLPADGSGEQRASYSPKAICASMCPFVLLGGARRHVPAEARILVHQIWPGAARADSTAAVYAAQHVAGLLRATSEIARYTVDMGGEIELFDLSMRIPPWEDLRILTHIEVQRTRLNTTDTPFAPLDADAVSSPPGVLPPTGGQFASFQRWTLVGTGAERSVVRRHPLTREGEEIGTLLVTFACGEKPMSMTVRYWETRRLASADDAVMRAVIGLGRERVPLTIEFLPGRCRPARIDRKRDGPHRRPRKNVYESGPDHRGDADKGEAADGDPRRDDRARPGHAAARQGMPALD